MRKVQLTIKQEEVAPATTSDLVVMSNGNTLKEELSTSRSDQFSSEATITTSMEKVADGAYSGAYERGVMYGRTLINVLDKKKLLIGPNTTLENDGSITAIANGGYYNLYFSDNGAIKENSEYLLIYEIIENTLDVDFHVNGGYVVNGLYENIISNGVIVPPLTTGYFVEKVRTRLKSECVNDFKVLRTFINTGATVGTKIKYRVQLIEYQEGLENVEIPYFDGLCDVKMPILRNVGKNLLDPQTFIPLDKGVEYVRYENGYVLANFTNANTHFFYKVDLARLPKGMYTVIAKHEGERSYLGIQHTFKDGTKTWGKTQFNNDGSYAELGLYMQSTTNDPSLKVKAKIMLVANGDTTSPYEDYKSNILHTPEAVTLRSLPNGVRDELNLKTGEYIKRIGEVVLNGTENNWITIFNYNETDDYSTFKLDTALPNGGTVTYPLDAYVVDKMQNGRLLSELREFVHINNQPRVCIKLLRTKLSEQTVAGLKAWLQANPITIQYELETPIITKVALTSSAPMVKGEVVLPDGTYNTYDLSTGEHIQRVKKVVLDGSEAWRLGTTKTNTQVFELVTQDLSISPANNIVCDTFPINNGDNSDIEKIAASGTFGSHDASSSLYVAVLKTKASTVEQFKSFLNSKPITVWYKLKEFIVTQITDPESSMIHSSSPVVYKGGHIMLESSYEGPSLLPEFVYSVPTSKSGVLSTTSKTILKHEQRLHQFEDLLLRESLLMDYRLTLTMLDSM